MIEQAIFSFIGFLVAALLAVAAAPAVSRRARRLAEARARLQAPLTEAQAIAERDALRAQHAVDQVRLEQRLSAVADRAAQRQIEIGRQADQIISMGEDAAERETVIAAHLDRISGLEREAREFSGDLGALQIALRDLTFQRDASDTAAASAQARRIELRTLADQNRTTIATLQMRVESLEVRLADSERDALAAAKAAETERTRLAAELAERVAAAGLFTPHLEAATAEAARLGTDLAATRTRLGDAEARLSRSEAAREAALLENGRQLARLAERDAALREAEGGKRDLAEQLRVLTAAQAPPGAASGAETPPAGRATGDQALRKAIARLAHDMARLNGKEREVEAEPSNLVSFDRREALAYPAASSEPMHSAPAGKIRQGQPMAPER